MPRRAQEDNRHGHPGHLTGRVSGGTVFLYWVWGGNIHLLLFIIFATISVLSFGDKYSALPKTDPNLVKAIEASPQYRFHVFTRQVEGRQETVVLLGESHTKSAEGSELGIRFLKGFYGDIGVEGVDWENFVMGQYLRPIIYGLHDATGSVLFGKDRKGTTIQDAYQEVNEADPLRSVVRLEKGHQPDLMENASLLMIVTMMARTGTEITYRGGKLVVVTASSIYSLARQSPREWTWKTKMLGKRLGAGFSKSAGLSERMTRLLNWLKSLPQTTVQKIVNIPGNCVESVLQFLALSPNDPTRDFPGWKRVAVKLDSTLKYSFTGLFGANIYLYLNPQIPVGLINNRNEEMVANGLEHIEGHSTDDDSRPLLVIAGMAHLKGWKYFLEKEGFSEQ